MAFHAEGVAVVFVVVDVVDVAVVVVVLKRDARCDARYKMCE